MLTARILGVALAAILFGGAHYAGTLLDRASSERVAAEAARVAEGGATKVRDALTEIVDEIDLVDEVHDVRVRDAGDGEIVNFHCHVDASIKVSDMHEKVDDVERALRLRFPSIKRVIGHAEPTPVHG